MNQPSLASNDVHHGIIECRQRLRRSRVFRKPHGRLEDEEQSLNVASSAYDSPIDQPAPSRARCEVNGEADVT